ncbi:sodium-independent anion transporter [Rhodospirillum rubrum]|uniref:SulP family inorganic anion transporter n=1 Tax=Rhodospirillum rubrum TaxID=1085 RepID=UPI0019082234|nr:SulP family inorganic anion transporter [Rhodospirillum rubrum]MBK1664159.1 sodium-independent anion transporter [Rhodospirillum rubrum]MBK1675820.1 sodium-independent anion transporter [Rhodospirillum rubrum]
MASFSRMSDQWFGNVPRDLLAGTVVALALIPEAIAFSIIAGVDPKVGLYASFCMSVVIAFTGGRPGMISAATGAMALVMVSLVKDHGLNYLLAATLLTGVLQILAGALRLGRVMTFVSRSVMTGFVNALAILIFMAQLPELINRGWLVYGMVAGGLAIIYLVPRVTKAVPSPLVCIVVLTALSIWLGLDVRTVGDMGELPSTVPVFLLPDIPLTWETLRIILPYSVTLAAVGLLESLMTASIIDDLTDSESNKNRECIGQGTANIVSGVFGGMAGCAMIGQSVINVKSGGRGRLSALSAGCFLLFLILVLGDWVRQIPMAALVAVMIMVSIGTFSWSSLKSIKDHPRSSTIVMLTTVVIVVATHDLAQGVLAGVVLSTVFFAHKVAQLVRITSSVIPQGTERTYVVSGQVFFVSADAFVGAFDFREVLERVVIDLSRAHFWDISAVAALDKVVLKFRRDGTEVHLIGLNEASATIVDKLAVHDKDDAIERLSSH